MNNLRARPGVEVLESRLQPSAQSGRTFVVTNLADGGAGSLRDAIAAANADPDADSIRFSAALSGGTIAASAGFAISSPIRIAGDSARGLNLRGGQGITLFDVAYNGDLTLDNLTLTGCDNRGNGGAIFNGGRLSLANCTISGNHSVYGGGLYNIGTAALANCTVAGNTALGKYQLNPIRDLETPAIIGFSETRTPGFGGGLYNTGTLRLTGCTISANTSSDLFLDGIHTPTRKNAGDGAGIFNDGFSYLANTIIAGNRSRYHASDAAGNFASLGHNLIGIADYGAGWRENDRIGTVNSPLDPRLGVLSANGGPAFTMALLADSAAIDAGDDALAAITGITDQRGAGFPRRFGRSVDIGAYEAIPKLFTGSGAGSEVRGFDASTGELLCHFSAFDPGFTGGVHVAVADVNGDGVLDVIAGAGPGAGPHVKVIDGSRLWQIAENGEIAESSLMGSFYAFDEGFRGGVTVAAGRFDDGPNLDIVVGAGAGAGPHVRIFALNDGTPSVISGALGSFYAFDPEFRGGVAVAVGRIADADQLIVAAGPGADPSVLILRADGRWISSFIAYDAGYCGGVSIATGDWDGDGRLEIITGPSEGIDRTIRVFDGTDGRELQSFVVPADSPASGLRVGATDLNGDGLADLLTALGPGGEPSIRGFAGLTLVEIEPRFAYDPVFRGGVFIAGG